MKLHPNKLVNQNNNQIQLEQFELLESLRKEWLRNPKTRIKKSDKIYNRKLSKKQINDILKREDF